MTNEERHPELRTASLAEVAALELSHAGSVTSIIEQRVLPGATEAYERWLKTIIPLAARFPGHRGVNVLRPQFGASTYTITLRFDSLAHAEDWFRSAARRQLIEEALPFLDGAEKIDTVTGLEFWFQAGPAQKTAPRYKQYLLTLSVIYPLTLVVPFALTRLFAGFPFFENRLVEHLIASATVVGLMVYLIMPRYTRLMSKWLYG